MIIEFTRLWREVLNDAEKGVNALLPQIPRDHTDEGPPQVDLYDWTNDEWAAGWTIPKGVLKATRGALIIKPASDIATLPVPVNTEMRAQQSVFALVVFYATLLDAATQTRHGQLRNCDYTMRAVQRATHRWFEDTRLTPELRTRNQCFVAEARDFGYLLLPQDTDGFIGWGVILEVRMTDRWAEFISET